MRSIYVQLNIPPEEFQRLYEGVAKTVNARSLDGRNVNFPANILRPFITHSGITGTFAIHFSDENRFQRIEKID
ncbi:hypothetical protein GCM10011613_13290 [Cellvibrio zantedeschiae]|uniref:DUF2835 domain-containing protein n=1 Tax=Cellvibrio zantedeschiae TaxID=1237077 RepID=A0ABQ3AXU6_9GAMM|nr:DUF2835 domain-containing protein [Cellvibrio zantedeschiae]GGY70218.1 hypothetical protein GCM10011613_13290 [Cellvibrio zantedeschiae]